MMLCPLCGADNIEGSDACESCEQPLTEEHLAEPESAVERGLLHDHIPALSPRPPIVVSPDTPVGDVLRLLLDKKIGCVIVTEGSRVAGIFSERDALRKLGPEASTVADHPISEFMTSSVESLEDTAKIAFAVQRMDLGGFRHVPIVDATGTPTGIISARDVLRYLTDRIRARP